MRLTKAQFAGLGQHDRYLIFILGQMLNELNIVRKTGLLATLNISDEHPYRLAEASQAFFFMKLLSGKTFEAWEAFRRHIIAHPIAGPRYAPLIAADPEAGQARDELGRIFAENTLASMRNDHVFHFPGPQDIEAAFQTVPVEEDWSFYLSEINGNSFYSGSDMVANHAVLQAFEAASTIEAIQKLGDQVTAASGRMIDLLGNTLKIVISENLPDADVGLPIIDRDDLPDIVDLKFPFFWSGRMPEFPSE